MLVDEMIHAACVGFKETACRRIDEAEIAFGGAAESECAELLIDIECGGTEDFGELTATDATQQIHLPEAVLRDDITLGLGHVFDGTCANVRHAPMIALDDHVFLQARQINVAVELRQRAINVTPKNGGHDHDDDADQNEQNAKQRSQAGS